MPNRAFQIQLDSSHSAIATASSHSKSLCLESHWQSLPTRHDSASQQALVSAKTDAVGEGAQVVLPAREQGNVVAQAALPVSGEGSSQQHLASEGAGHSLPHLPVNRPKM